MEVWVFGRTGDFESHTVTVASRAFREPQCYTSATVTIKNFSNRYYNNVIKREFREPEPMPSRTSGNGSFVTAFPQATVLTMRAAFLVAEALEATRKDALEATDTTEQETTNYITTT